ncbi:flagellar assembly protein A [Massilia endophytica]|uniref:flagellar assembly protein A n=1 Tax=Massilia endophytica TaxID=2899220 RepID=UPI001E2E6A42|nr:flagellar assembly protein A [Massilia endophytica]UGQ44713.1 FapA family protein [Massilia endophytica]
MSNKAAAPEATAGGAASPAIVQRTDGVYFRADAGAAACVAAVNQLFQARAYFTGIDYGVFIRMLYEAGPELPPEYKDKPLVRFADAVAPFSEQRRSLYKSVRIIAGEAEYYFEPVYLNSGTPEETPSNLDFGEFVADMWEKGIRFGIDAPVVSQAIEEGKSTRLTVARRLSPAPGQDAMIVEVSQKIHRSNAPKEMANGRFDLHTYQNRFPQVAAHTPLLKKVPRVPGTRGFELSGIPVEPPLPEDVELNPMAGAGTVIQHLAGEDFLVSSVEGFINVDRRSKRISIGPKIISREGVSVRTTGNLQLSGEYEEFGEVQEGRVVDGFNITIHADVFGKIVSRGGSIHLKQNLMGGAATNADGPITVGGVVSNSVVHAKVGQVTLNSVQNSVITAPRVIITEATNCEIVADEVVIGVANGCAIAARNISIESAGPRKQSEMLLFALVPDTSKFDQLLQEVAIRLAQLDAQAQKLKAQIDAITSQQDVRSYLTLATKVRKQEVTLTPEQLPLFQKMAVQVGPALKEVARLSVASKEGEGQRAVLEKQAEQLREQKAAVAGEARCKVAAISGETLLRTMVFKPDEGPMIELPPREVKARLRAGTYVQPPIFNSGGGEIDWSTKT